MNNDTPRVNEAMENVAFPQSMLGPVLTLARELERENARLRDALERCAKMPSYGERFEIVQDALSDLPNDN